MYTKKKTKNIQASLMSNTYLVLSLNKTFRLNDGALHHSLPSIHSNNRQTVTKTISCLFSIFIMFVWISCRIHLFQTSIRGVSFNVFIQFILFYPVKEIDPLSHARHLVLVSRLDISTVGVFRKLFATSLIGLLLYDSNFVSLNDCMYSNGYKYSKYKTPQSSTKD